MAICYIDEYNLSDQDMRLYSWLPKGKEDYLLNQPRRQPLHIIAAVTDKELISLLVLTHTIKSEDFQSFLPDVVDRMRELYPIREELRSSTSLTESISEELKSSTLLTELTAEAN